MADFFEDLGKKISDVAEDLGKKGKIRSLKRANERDFLEIGKMVYDKFKSGEVSDLDYTGLCESIEKRDEEAAQHQDEIQKIKEAL